MNKNANQRTTTIDVNICKCKNLIVAESTIYK